MTFLIFVKVIMKCGGKSIKLPKHKRQMLKYVCSSVIGTEFLQGVKYIGVEKPF